MDVQAKPCYKRILLKLSGEALMGEDSFGINRAVLQHMIEELRTALDLGVQVGIVVGGGNIFRGVALGATGYGPRHRRLHGHARNSDERHGAAGLLPQQRH